VKPYYDHAGIRIFHGDCQSVLASLPDNSIDLILTDPPYGHNNLDGDLNENLEVALGHAKTVDSARTRPIANDGAEADTLVRWMFNEANRLLVRGGCACCCCCGGGGPDPQFARWSLWLDELLGFKQMIIWDKGIGIGWHYRRTYETILVGEKKGGPSKWYGNGFEPNVIRLAKPEADQHPTPKPLDLMAVFVRLHTAKGDVVLDPFMGSGTTLRAAKDLGRRAIGVEEEKYCEIAARRAGLAVVQAEA